eukprot:1157247-Pelagomonas_calceolata.AAC.4
MLARALAVLLGSGSRTHSPMSMDGVVLTGATLRAITQQLWGGATPKAVSKVMPVLLIVSILPGSVCLLSKAC